MRWNTAVARIALVVIVVVLAAMATAAWRSRQTSRLHTQQQRELELEKRGGADFMRSIGTPADALKQTGNPFGPPPEAPKKHPKEPQP